MQWVTAGAGIMHSEMFPLLNTDQPNPLELFQIWLNLPASHKMVKPHFTMLWNERIPRLHHTDEGGKHTTVTVIAGALEGADAPLPATPESWASQEGADLAIWTISLEPGARWTLPAAKGAETRRMLYWFVGNRLQLAGQALDAHAALQVEAGRALELVNTGSETAELAGPGTAMPRCTVRSPAALPATPVRAKTKCHRPEPETEATHPCAARLAAHG